MIVIADDLTGAADAAAGFLKFGRRAAVTAGIEGVSLAEKYDDLAVNTASRELLPNDAYLKVFSAARLMKNADIYKKIDSVLRGNPAEEIEAVLDGAGYDFALVSPSFPENGRKMSGGILRAPGGIEVDVVSIFGKNIRRKAGHIPLETVRGGKKAILAAINRMYGEGKTIFVTDAESSEDLVEIASVRTASDKKVLLCGSAGLAQQIAMGKKRSEKKDLRATGAVLVAIASRTDVTRQQVEHLLMSFGLEAVIMPVDEILKDEESRTAVIKRTSEKAAEFLNKGRRAVICTSSLFEDFDLLNRQTETEKQQAGIIADAVAAAVKKTSEFADIFGFVTSGGDCSLAVMKAFLADAIELYDEVLPGIPAGMLVSQVDEDKNRFIVTKSGGFGAKDAIEKAVLYLEEILKGETKNE